MENQRSLRQTLRRPKTDEEIFDRITPAKHSRSKSLVDVHSSRGVHQAREPSREHDRRAQEDESRSLGLQHSESESDSDGSLLPPSPQKLSMAPRTLQQMSDFSPASAFSSAYTGDILDNYAIEPFLDETWSDQLTQWDSSVNRHARFACDMESSSGDEKERPREAQTPKPVRKRPLCDVEILTSLPPFRSHGPTTCQSARSWSCWTELVRRPSAAGTKPSFNISTACWDSFDSQRKRRPMLGSWS